MTSALEIFESLTPVQRIAIVGAIVGALLNVSKRLPKVPSKWVPAASFALAALVSAGSFYLTNLTHVGMGDFVIQALLAGALPIAGHKFIRKPWAALLGEASADKWLGQADDTTSS